MKIWKTTFISPSGESAGFGYGKTKKESIENAIVYPESIVHSQVQITVEYSAKGIIKALNMNGHHPDNG